MKKVIVILIILFLLISTISFLSNNNNNDSMNIYKGAGKTIKNVIKYTLFPVFATNDIPKDLDPTKRSINRNGANEILSNELTIASWNILRNYNQDQIKNSLSKIMKEQTPGIILIQESPVYNDSAFFDDDLFSNFNVFYAPLHQVETQTDFYNFSQTGQLTLSLYPFTKTEVYPLPSVSGDFHGEGHYVKRVALYTQVEDKEGKKIGIYNVHLENNCWQNGRRKQLEYLLDIIDKNDDDVVVIGGDFNTFLQKLERGITLLEKEGFEKLISGFRVLPLDHFMVRGSEAVGVRLKGEGSDHQPILARLKLE